MLKKFLQVASKEDYIVGTCTKKANLLSLLNIGLDVNHTATVNNCICFDSKTPHLKYRIAAGNELMVLFFLY